MTGKRLKAIGSSVAAVAIVAAALYAWQQRSRGPGPGPNSGTDEKEPGPVRVEETEPFDLKVFVPRFVTWHGDGVGLFTVGDTHTVLWDADTGAEVRRWQHARRHQPSAFLGSPLSPDGARIALLDPAPVAGRLGRVLPTSGEGDGLTLAAAETGGTFRFVSWSPDGKRLLLLGHDGTLYLWDAATGRPVGSLSVAGPARPGDLVFLPPESFGRVFSRNGLDLDNAAHWSDNPAARHQGGGGGSGSWDQALWSADGGSLLTLSNLRQADPLAVLWDGRTGRPAASLSVPGRHWRRWAFSPDGARLAALTVDLGVGRSLPPEEPWPSAREAGRDAPFSRTAAVRVHDPATGATLATLTGDHPPAAFAWSPDGRRLVVADAGLDPERPHTYEIACRDAATGDLVWAVQAELGRVESLAFRPDGKQIALTFFSRAGPAGSLGLEAWDAETARPLWQASVATLADAAAVPAGLAELSWAPGGGHLVAGRKLWQADGGGVVVPLDEAAADAAPPNRPLGLAWSRDGKRLAVFVAASGGEKEGERPARIRLWDVAAGKEVRRLLGPPQ
jgi:WD40 repeat protein